MKLIKIRFVCAVITALSALLFQSCKKTTGDTVTIITNDTATQAIIASDELNVNYEFDQAVINAIIATSISTATSSNALLSTISGAVLDTTEINMGVIKIDYYGKNANNTKGLTGEVDITLAMDNGKIIPWGTKGAIATIAFKQYEVTILKTNVSLWMNGAGTVTNISGGSLNNIADSLLVPGDSLIDKVSAQLAYTYNDNSAIITTWTWNFNQLRVFNYNDTTIVMKATGDTTVNAAGNVITSGATRTGQTFYTSAAAPVIQNISGAFFLYNPVRGVKIIHGIAEPITITYGVDANGNVVNNSNPYGYKITWTNTSGQTQQLVIGY